MALRGIFGGTFDPVHLGHLRCAWELAGALEGPVHMIPCGQPAHRDGPVASAGQRLAMLQQALVGQHRLLADDREIRRSGPSYMVDTLASLATEYPDDHLCLAVGADAFLGLDQWHQWERLFELAHVVVLERPGVHVEPGAPLTEWLRHGWVESVAELQGQRAGQVLALQVTALDISATTVRRLFAAGDPPRYLLPAKVLDYALEHGLYR